MISVRLTDHVSRSERVGGRERRGAIVVLRYLNVLAKNGRLRRRWFERKNE